VGLLHRDGIDFEKKTAHIGRIMVEQQTVEAKGFKHRPNTTVGILMP